jgi:hypothetical protein
MVAAFALDFAGSNLLLFKFKKGNRNRQGGCIGQSMARGPARRLERMHCKISAFSIL